MSQTTSSTNLFKFNPQEEKFNQLKNFSFTSSANKIGERYEKSDRTVGENKKDVVNLDEDEYKNTFYKKPDYDNEYVKLTTDHFKSEISELKSYINRLNKEIRKQFQIEIPILDNINNFNNQNDNDSNKISKREENFTELIKYFSDSFERLLNPEYLNPIFTMYDKHILNIESESKHFRNLCTKYEKRINELTKENSNLRENNLIQSSEIQDMLKTKIENNSVIPIDEEFFKYLDERNNILSKENEILAINYQKVSKDLFDFSLNFSDKHKESIQKIEIYDRLEDEVKKLTYILEDVMTKNNLYENKFMELSEELSKIEIEKNNYMILCDKFQAENRTLIEANVFYKNFIDKSV